MALSPDYRNRNKVSFCLLPDGQRRPEIEHIEEADCGKGSADYQLHSSPRFDWTGLESSTVSGRKTNRDSPLDSAFYAVLVHWLDDYRDNTLRSNAGFETQKRTAHKAGWGAFAWLVVRNCVALRVRIHDGNGRMKAHATDRSM